MTNYLGTTGTRQIPDPDRYTEFLFSEGVQPFLEGFDGFVTGGCKGWDSVFGETMVKSFGASRQHVIVIPGIRSQIDPWWERYLYDIQFEIIEMPEGSSYKQRNQMIVNLSEQIYYCADFPENHGNSIRSGTWQTVRLAQSRALPVSGFVIHREES